MTLDQIIEYYRSPAEVAQALGLSTATPIHQWRLLGYVPAMRQLQIQALTHGKLKADNMTPRHALAGTRKKVAA